MFVVPFYSKQRRVCNIAVNHPIFSRTVPRLRCMSCCPAMHEIILHALHAEWHHLDCDVEMAESSSSSVTQANTFDNIYTPGAPEKLRKDCRFKQEWDIYEMLPSKRGPTFVRFL